MPVKNIARPEDELVTARPETSVRTLARRLRDSSVGSVIVEASERTETVMTDRGPRAKTVAATARTPAGIVTDRDLVIRVLASDEDIDDLTAADVMTEDPVTVDADDNIFTLCSKMRQHDVRRLPVMEDGGLCGIITLDDIVWLVEDEIDNLEKITNDIAAVIESESPPFAHH